MLDLIFVFLNFGLLGRLRKRLQQCFPGQMEQIWDSLGYNVQIGIAAAPSVFTFISDRAALLIVFVARRDEIPVMLLGDDEIAELVFKLNQKRSAWLYRILNKTCGLS